METLGDVVRSIWARASDRVDAPAAWVVLAAAAAALLLIVYPPSWRLLRHGLTIIHEGAHALVALLCGRRLQGIRLHRDTSGLTVSRGRPRGLGMVLTAFAGYVGPAVLGVGAAWLVGRGFVAGFLWMLLIIVFGVGVQIRNLFGVLPVLGAGLAIFALAWWAPGSLQVGVAYGIIWFLLLGSVRPVFEMQSERRRLLRSGRRSSSDADVLGSLTHLPGGVWIVIFALVVLACAVLGASWLIDSWEAGGLCAGGWFDLGGLGCSVVD